AISPIFGISSLCVATHLICILLCPRLAFFSINYPFSSELYYENLRPPRFITLFTSTKTFEIYLQIESLHVYSASSLQPRRISAPSAVSVRILQENKKANY